MSLKVVIDSLKKVRINWFYTTFALVLFIVTIYIYNEFYLPQSQDSDMNTRTYANLVFTFPIGTLFVINYFYGIYVFFKSKFQNRLKYIWIIHALLPLIYFYYYYFIYSFWYLVNLIIVIYFYIFLTLFFIFYSKNKEEIQPPNKPIN